MTTITLEVPDQLAKAIEPMRSELPALLAITQHLFYPTTIPEAHTSAIYLAYKQLLDFFAALPSPEQIKRFVISQPAQQRVHELLDKHGEGELDAEEQIELRVYSQISAVLNLRKAQAALELASHV